MYRGFGVHHVGVGVKNLETMKSFYKETLGFTNVFMEEPMGEVDGTYEMFRMPSARLAMIMLQQEAGGVIDELVQMSNPVPRPIRKETRYGDIGVAKIAIAVSNVERLYEELKGKVNFCSKPKSTKIPGWGDYAFVYGRDPEGNLIEFVSGSKLRVANRFGGSRWIGISVTDLERSRSFYQKYLGFDTLVVNSHSSFSGLVDEISGGSKTQVQSCIISNSRGGGMLELFEVLKPRGRSIPLATYWGDFGYLEVCLLSNDIHETEKHCEKEGLEILCRPVNEGERTSFMYIRDPDGNPVEFIIFRTPEGKIN
jgi:catechol 2,3-dioxygenase-like lactoylglutathione lyase family enzyme